MEMKTVSRWGGGEVDEDPDGRSKIGSESATLN